MTNNDEQMELAQASDKIINDESPMSNQVAATSRFCVSPKHAEDGFRIMESYLHKQQLTDVTLIAGKDSTGLLFLISTYCKNLSFLKSCR